MTSLVIVNTGTANLASVRAAFTRLGRACEISDDASRIEAAPLLVLPGVGAFGQATRSLPDDPYQILDALDGGLPCLGICLGMQLFFERSDEDEGSGIGFLRGSVERLRTTVVPQMGWNDVETDGDALFDGTDPLVAYYANSYVCIPEDAGTVIGWSEYDGVRFAAAVRKRNVWGVQFHPEKSGRNGLRLLANYLALSGTSPC